MEAKKKVFDVFMTFKGIVLRNNAKDNLICDNVIAKSYLMGVSLLSVLWALDYLL